MSEYYKVVEIPGKGLGCVAVKKIQPGTVILTGEPDVIAQGDISPIWTSPSKKLIESLMSSFKSLSQTNQEEYLSLHNQWVEELREKSDKILPKDLILGMNQDEKQKILKVYGIYKTNTRKDGLSLKGSRFNHSCGSNAAYIWGERTQCFKISVVFEIEIGEEISINYAPKSLFMKNFQTRQTALSRVWGFKCSCNICVDESQNNADDLYEEFAKLRQEFPPYDGEVEFVSFTSTQRKIAAIRKMKSLVLKKKSSRIKLCTITEDGLFAATAGYIHAKREGNRTLIREFQNEAENFAKQDAKIRKMIDASFDAERVKRSENTRQWMDEQIRFAMPPMDGVECSLM